jgi:hypothetical protein
VQQPLESVLPPILTTARQMVPADGLSVRQRQADLVYTILSQSTARGMRAVLSTRYAASPPADAGKNSLILALYTRVMHELEEN